MDKKVHHHPTSGTVIGVNYPIIKVSGLANATAGELVHFEEGGRGQIISLTAKDVKVMAFSKNIPRAGSIVRRLGQKLQIHLNREVLGCLVNPLGHFSCKTPKEEREARDIDIPPLPLTRRAPITATLKSGVALTDLLLPLGKGQRELVVGDRKTGKTTFILQLCRTQISLGNIVIYASIGKRSAEIKQLIETARTGGLLPRMVVVASRADDSPAQVALTPFTAMTIAEYFRDQGSHTVVVFDDLTTHAKFYREVSLLAQKFPGRDSYPGDIFYLHARLLERAGNFFREDHKKAFSITALPMAESFGGELTDFIVSNLISITDGHLFFDSDLFARGLRPAINTGLSVTRVGKQTQSPLEREMNYQLNLFFSEYERVRGLTHFGSEISEHARTVLARGGALLAFFEQPKEVVFPTAFQLIFSQMLMLDWFADKKPEEIRAARDNFLKTYEADTTAQKFCNGLFDDKGLFAFNQGLVKYQAKLLKLCQL